MGQLWHCPATPKHASTFKPVSTCMCQPPWCHATARAAEGRVSQCTQKTLPCMQQTTQVVRITRPGKRRVKTNHSALSALLMHSCQRSRVTNPKCSQYIHHI